MKTTVVGSYPVPSWLSAFPTDRNLQDALLTVLKTQELAGLDLLGDGELQRFTPHDPDTNGMIEHFVRPLQGVRTRFTRAERLEFRALPGMQFRKGPAGVVTGELGPGELDLTGEYERTAALTERPLKFTLTSPYMLAKTLLDRHYGDLRSLCQALADVLAEQLASVDAPVVQIDEANLTGNPEDAVWAFEPINRVLKAARQATALHLCFGNYGGRTIQQGTWRALIEFFNRLEVDDLILEFARRGYEELQAFGELRPEIGIGVGVIDIKDNEVESPGTVARRITTAAESVGMERIRWVHPDCGFWMLPRSVADAKMRALVRGRDLFLGNGSA